ncbi:hypothetical protein RQP53_20060 [Paucibacter sp. APW11]|uniref:Uncharacterized protein n=1 Tax=Roseateles aquae TaxID=3077235 RepID=A0ABU3PHL4_9BURK|nr:hypothetical protein [Paucibacter sp. APW11]MDT9001582.1 hypothetical protein [Paucibacter sp. APW11]
MTDRSLRHTVRALLLGSAMLLGGLASASSLVSAIDSLSTSLGSASDSIQSSSQSSTGGRRVAAGDYRIIEVAQLPSQADGAQFARLQLQGSEGQTFYLRLPLATLQQAALAAGTGVSASERPYGLAFSRQGEAAPFYLVLDDDWYQELRSRPVRL